MGLTAEAGRRAAGLPIARRGLCLDQFTLDYSFRLFRDNLFTIFPQPQGSCFLPFFKPVFLSFRNAAQSSVSGNRPPRPPDLGQPRGSPPGPVPGRVCTCTHSSCLFLAGTSGVTPEFPPGTPPHVRETAPSGDPPHVADGVSGDPVHPGRGQTQALQTPLLGLVNGSLNCLSRGSVGPGCLLTQPR